VLVLLTGAGPVALAEDALVAVIDGGGDSADPLRCVERATIPTIDNTLDTVWSPTGTHLAFTRIVASNSARTVTGYEEDPGIGILELATGRITTFGEGRSPRWSASGQYLSFWRDGRLFIINNGRHIRTLDAGMPEVRWVGDQLIHFYGREIRAWTPAGEVTLSVLSYEHWPIFPRDWADFSADGRLFTLTHYYQDGRAARFVGETRNGQLAPLDAPGATYTEWAPSGQTLLIRSDEHVELRGPSGWKVSAPLAAFDGTVHGWTADGKALLMGRVTPTIPAGTTFDRFQVWNGQQVATATLPNLLGARGFSPDGNYFAGVARAGLYETTLEVYRCGTRGGSLASRADPISRSRQQRVDADPRRFVRPLVGYFTQFLQGAHTGIDIAAPFGSLITAADEGRVTFAGWRPSGGRAVCVLHDNGIESCYYHNSLALVRVGEWVSRGEPVAAVGLTGLTSGPHVHWEVKSGGRIVDPLSR
jgi:murein DD-endopeptidase MepM/ murein hydrolase activator NlpD